MSQVLGKKISDLPRLGDLLRRSTEDTPMAKKKTESSFAKAAKEAGISVPDSDGPSNGMEADFIVIDEAEGINGLSDTDGEPFSFSSDHREYSITMDAYDYHVTPDSEYGDLDFKGKTVLINGRERRCDDFRVDDDGKLVITVHCRADD